MKNNKIIVIPFTLPWDHSADYQRQTCLELSRRGYHVIAYMTEEAAFFLQKKDRIPSLTNVEFYQPVFYLPLRRLSFINELNFLIDRLLLNLRLYQKEKIIWIFDPQFYNFSSAFSKKVTIYDCVDYQTTVTKSVNHRIRFMEKKIIKEADYFFTNSCTLKRINQKNRKAKLVVQGVKVDKFIGKYQAIKKNKKPIVGYLGGINHRLDFKLLINLIKNNQGWDFQFWGPQQSDEQDSKFHTKEYIQLLKKFPNVYWYFSQDHKELGQAISNFNVGIIPYDTNQKINLYSFPMKTFEYWLFGIPIVSTNILELKNPEFKPLVTFGKNWHEFANEINKFLKKPLTLNEKNKAKDLANKHSWKNKIGQILFVINHSIKN